MNMKKECRKGKDILKEKNVKELIEVSLMVV
jgi:hypothetical protein